VNWTYLTNRRRDSSPRSGRRHKVWKVSVDYSPLRRLAETFKVDPGGSRPQALRHRPLRTGFGATIRRIVIAVEKVLKVLVRPRAKAEVREVLF
jgi:hypothetical protein